VTWRGARGLERTRLCLRPVNPDQTHLLIKNPLRVLTGDDQTLAGGASGRGAKFGLSVAGTGSHTSGHGVGASGLHLAAGAGSFDRWRSAKEVERGGLVAAYGGPDAGSGASGRPDQRV
jgi:hypothetical protein